MSRIHADNAAFDRAQKALAAWLKRVYPGVDDVALKAKIKDVLRESLVGAAIVALPSGLKSVPETQDSAIPAVVHYHAQEYVNSPNRRCHACFNAGAETRA